MFFEINLLTLRTDIYTLLLKRCIKWRMNRLLTRRADAHKWMSLFASATKSLFFNDFITFFTVFSHRLPQFTHYSTKISKRNAHLLVKIMAERL